LITCLAYCIDKELYKAIDYLREQVRVLVEQQEKGNKRILLTNSQRMRVAVLIKAKWDHASRQETPMNVSRERVVKVGEQLLLSRVQGDFDSRVTQCLHFVTTNPDFVHLEQKSTSIFCIRESFL